MTSSVPCRPLPHRLLILVSLALSTACASGPAPGADIHALPPSDSGFTVRQLAPGVHAVIRNEPQGMINESNSLVIVGDTGVIVVDAQSSTARTRETLAAIRRLTDRRITTVINTHWHDDHTVGNSVYREDSPGVAFVGHEHNAHDMETMGVQFRKGAALEARRGTIEYLRSFVSQQRAFVGGPIDADEARSHLLSAWLLEDYSNGDSDFRPLTPTHPVRDQLVLRLGDREVRVLFLGRGHTRGDVVVQLPREGIVAAGDLLMWPIPFVGSTSFPADFAVTLERLRELRPRLLVPGHGPVLDASTFDAHAALVASTLRFIADGARAAVARGEDLETARRRIDLTEYRDALAGTSTLRRGMFSYYVEQSAVARAHELARASQRSADAQAPLEVELVAPGIVSTVAGDLPPTFSPDGRTALWSISTSLYARWVTILESTIGPNGEFGAPRVPSFAGRWVDVDPFFSHDGTKLYFLSRRPRSGSAPESGYRIWVVPRTAKGWGEPTPLPEHINAGDMHYANPVRSGALYVSGIHEGGAGQGDIYYVPIEGSGFGPMRRLGAEINTDRHETTPYVDPDERFMIFSTTRSGAVGGLDLFISFRDGESWSTPLLLPEPINSRVRDFCPIASPDGQWLYFASDRSLIDQPLAAPLDVDQVRQLMNGPGNTASDVYRTSLPGLLAWARAQTGTK